MFKKLCLCVLFLSLLFPFACTQANRKAEEVGKAGGKIMRIPGSVSEGAAEGVAGESDSNPYNR
jgi:hypothetical protein